MADCKYLIDRSNLHNVRKQTSQYLCDLDARVISLEDAPSGGVAVEYKYTVALSGDPTSGYLGCDTLVYGTVTEVRISKFTRNGNDASALIVDIDIGSLLGVFEELAPSHTCYFETTALPVAVGDYFTIAVTQTTFLNQELPSVDDADITVYLVANAAGLMPSGGVRPEVLKKNSGDNYDAVWEKVAHGELTGVGIDDHHDKSHTHDGNDGSGSVAHIDTTGRTPNDHHQEVHAHDGIDGSGTVAHEDTTGRTADDHHNKVHSHDGIDGSGTVAHADTTGQGIDDHHDKSHTHDGLDGSGTILHSSTQGKTPNDHHNQAHLLYGTDQSDVNSVPALETRNLLAYSISNGLFNPEFRMNWRNKWVQQEYEKHDVVIDQPYTMVANKVTSDRAAPQDNGEPAWDLPEIPTWADFSNVSTVGSGHTYVFTETVYVNSVRVWIPDSDPNIIYKLTIITDASAKQRSLLDTTAGQWNVIGIDPTLVIIGSTLNVYLEALNQGTETHVIGGWLTGSKDNNNEPANESWNSNTQNSILRIDFDDLDSLDRQTELEGIVVGSDIQFTQVGEPNNSVTYHVTGAPVTGLTSVSWGVIITDTGVGVPAVGIAANMDATIHGAQATEFVGIINGWVGNELIYASVTSLLEYDGVDQGADPENQYGVSINVQRIIISPDWDLLALSGGSGGGGGDFIPQIFEGAGTTGYVPDPIIETGKVLDDTGVWVDRTGVFAEAFPTGLYDGGELNIVGLTNVEVIAGAGVIIDSYTDPLAQPTHQNLSWATQNEPILGSPATDPVVTHILIADSGSPAGAPIPDTNLGTVIQSTTIPTPAQVRDNIYLGYVIWNTDTWGEVSSPLVVNSVVHTLADYLENIAGRTFIESGGKITEAVTFSLDRSAGVVWEYNRNWHANRKDPDRESFLEQLSFQWRYVNQDLTIVSALTSVVDPANYDLNGIITPVGGNIANATIQRLYVDGRDNYWVLYGQNIYDSFNEAAADIGGDTTHTIFPDMGMSSLFLGYIISERAETQWKPEEAEFYTQTQATGGSSGGGGAETFLELTDTPADYIGQSGRVATVNGLEDGLEFTDKTPPQTYLHEDLTDVNADQHHPKSHSHNGVDGSGTVNHPDLGSIGENDHHPKLHDLTSHTDVDITAPADGEALVYNGATWRNLALSSGFLPELTTGNVVATANRWFVADTTGGAFTITLPASPSLNDFVMVEDVGGDCTTNNVVVLRNGKLIDNIPEDFDINLDWGDVLFVYDGTQWAINPAVIGSQGDQGIQGVQGDQGIQGVKGDTGSQGVQGIQGEKGDQGDTGAKGDTGLKGDTGSQGIQGDQGLQGEQGIQGIQGVKGDTGNQGAQGVQGIGITVYEQAGEPVGVIAGDIWIIP